MALSISNRNLFLSVPFALLLLLFISFAFAQENLPDNQPNDDGWIYNHTKTPWPGMPLRGQLRCIGDWPDLMRDFGRRGLIGVHSLLEFCAEPGYGGRLNLHPQSPSQHGGFCAFFLDAPRFFMSRPYRSEGISYDWKREALCQAKCLCEWFVVSDRLESQATIEDRRLPYMPGDIGHAFQFGPTSSPAELNLMESNLVQHPIPLYLSSNGFTRQFTANSAAGAGNARWEPQSRLMRKTTVSGHTRNTLTCNEELPLWPMPQGRLYDSTFDLCSASFLGGHPIANAGGVCINHNTNLVQYRDEFSNPVYSTSIVRFGSYRATTALAIGYWCMTSCVCALPDYKGKPHQATNKIKGYGEVIRGADGSLSLRMKGTRKKPGKTISIVQALTPGSVPTGQCDIGRDGRTWCFADLAAGELDAPPMRGPKDIFSRLAQRLGERPPLDAVMPQVMAEDTCGNVCEGPQDCDGCLCQVDLASPETISESYDPVAGRIIRHATLALCVSVVTSNPTIGGRGEPSTPPPLCACNGTYISPGCCGNVDGIIWESKGQKWGELDL